MNQSRRVVVTGVGICSPLGMNVETFWINLLNGVSGISQTSDAFSFLPSRVAGIISDQAFNKQKSFVQSSLKNDFNIDFTKDWRSISRSSSFAIFAVNEAFKQIKWKINSGERAGVYFGVGMEGVDEILQTASGIMSKKYSAVGPHALTRSLTNMPAGIISRIWKLRGPCMAANTACATGLHCIGEAYRMIKYGEADLVVAGACEAPINPWIIASFSRIRALSTKFNDKPDEASRPFDELRNGFVISEGAGAVILQAWPPSPEFLESSFEEVPTPLAEIIGFGRSGDAYHLVAPEPTGSGALRSMTAAMKDSNLQNLNEINHINCHATSTPLGDQIELGAIAQLIHSNHTKSSLNNTVNPIIINSIKSNTGHALAAAGAFETIYTILSVNKGLIVGNLNLHNPVSLEQLKTQIMSSDPDKSISSIDNCLELFVDSTYLPKHSEYHMDWLKSTNRRIAMTNSFGFGGTNGTLIISQWCD